MKKKKLGRRKFIKLVTTSGALVAADPLLKHLAGSIYDGYMSEAVAQGIPPRNLVYFAQYGGATPWYFYSPLTPSPGDENKFIPCKQASTKINEITQDSLGNPIYDLEYATTSVTKGSKTINMPHMFSWSIPRAGGGNRPTTDICDNMLMIRGIKMADDSHDLNERLMHGPVPGSACISGIGADNAQTNLPCIALDELRFFKSSRGSGVIKVDRNASNYASDVMAAFDTYSSNSFRNSSNLKTTIYAALAFLKGHRGGDESPAFGLINSREKAEALIVAGIGDIAQEFEAASVKYLDLINRSSRNTNLPGLTDRVLPGLSLPITLDGEVEELKGKKNESNYRYQTCQYLNYSRFFTGSDLRSNYDNATVNRLNKQFALIEVLLRHNLCSVINAKLGTLSGISAETVRESDVEQSYNSNINQTTFSIKPGESASVNSHNVVNDNHSGGYLFTMLGFSLQYRAFASCLAELQDQLRNVTYSNGKSAWDESLIVLYSEMGRKPDDRGTEHYGNGNSIAMWGGTLHFDCLGDIYDESTSPWDEQYPGTWGSGRPIRAQDTSDPNLKGRRILNENIGTTICTILRYPTTPAPNNNSLVFIDEVNNSAAYQIPTGKTYVRNT